MFMLTFALACGPTNAVPVIAPVGFDASTTTMNDGSATIADSGASDAGGDVDASKQAGLTFSSPTPPALIGITDGVAFYPSANPGKNRLRIYFEKAAGLCTALLHQNATIFNVDLETASTPIAMGDYPISSAASTNAVIAWGSLDASCKAVTDGSDYAKTGTVKITRVSATEVAGEFSFTTAGGVSVQGQFSAPICGSEPSFMCVP
jgi:hypothetical protein